MFVNCSRIKANFNDVAYTLGASVLSKGHRLKEKYDIDGIIGIGFFTLNALTIDQKNKKLTLTPFKDFVPNKGDTVVNLNYSKRRLFVTLAVENNQHKALVDTGMAGSLRLPAKYASLLGPKMEHLSKGFNSEERLIQARGSYSNAFIDGYQINGEHTISVTERKIMKFPIVGNWAFKDSVVTFNLKKRRLYLRPSVASVVE